MIAIDSLTYYYPRAATAALRRVSLHVSAGEFILLSGPSGSGKSTLLRAINGLVPHFSGGRISGKVQVGDIDVIAAGPAVTSRTVGFVFQSPESQAVLDRVEPEIAFPLENAAVPPDVMRARVEEILTLLGLHLLRQRPLRTLSGGERQKVAIAAALAFRPRVLLLDEPTSQLDPVAAREVLQTVVHLNQELGLTVVLAEHRLERVLPHVDRLVHLVGGQIAADGPVADAVLALPDQPPVVALGRALKWRPLPLTVAAARPRAAQLDVLPAPRRPFSPPAKPVLDVRDLTFAYDRRPVLRSLSFQIGPGEIVALLGRNGSGKSTLLRCLIGLLRPQTGAILLLGRPTLGRAVADMSRVIAYLPQNPDDLLYAESVAAELRSTLVNHSRSGESILPWLERLGLESVAAAYPRDLSVGQRQRVALGAVAVTEPPLFLFDEPTRGLDYALKKELARLWREWRDSGRALLVATHDVELVASVADRILVLDDEGALAADGRPAEVLDRMVHLAPQMARLFPGYGRLTVSDVLAGLQPAVQLKGGSS